MGAGRALLPIFLDAEGRSEPSFSSRTQRRVGVGLWQNPGNNSTQIKSSSKKVCLGSAAQTTSRQADAQFGKVIRSKLGKLLARRGVPGAADMIRRIARRESEGGSQFSSSLGPRKV
jgi:hypothetical protein